MILRLAIGLQAASGLSARMTQGKNAPPQHRGSLPPSWLLTLDYHNTLTTINVISFELLISILLSPLAQKTSSLRYTQEKNCRWQGRKWRVSEIGSCNMLQPSHSSKRNFNKETKLMKTPACEHFLFLIVFAGLVPWAWHACTYSGLCAMSVVGICIDWFTCQPAYHSAASTLSHYVRTELLRNTWELSDLPDMWLSTPAFECELLAGDESIPLVGGVN